MRIRLDVLFGVVVLVDVLFVFLPSLITLVGSAGETPAEVMGAYALAWFVGAFLTVPAARFLGAGRVRVAAGAALVVARLVLQGTDGGDPQLYAASVGLFAGLVWLAATAMAARDSSAAMTGFVGGLALATTVHAALDGVDLVWRDGVTAWALLLVEVAVFAATLVRTPAERDEETGGGWLLVGPALLLWGIATGNAAHAQASDGWPEWSAAVVAGVAVASVAVAARPRFWTRHPAVPAVALVAAAAVFAFGRTTVDGVHGVAAWWAVPAQLVGQVALAACLGWAAARPRKTRPGRRGTAAAGGALLFVLLVFAYYSAYDLGVENRWVPVAAAVIVAAGARRASTAERGFGWRVPAAVAVAAAVVAAAPLWRVEHRWTPADGGLRLAEYNVRMGYGLDGTMTVRRQAAVLRSMRPHLVALSEVDRAWLLNGARDNLRLLEHELGLRAIWAPAGDEVWGDAVLTDLPVTAVRNEPLVKGGPTGAQALRVDLTWHGRPLTVIATHTQPPEDWRDLGQARQLARLAREAAADGRPVILTGDLNLRPGDAAWRVLVGAGLVDGLAPARPLPTFPALPRPDDPIDQVLVTPGLTTSAIVSPAVGYSDHRPVGVTVAVP
ncbi:endonuclease/exonuclease/phosphatase family protein [Actinomadura atramentaria]|uniref:endonuclease/exonuclease/phosphatase family protein n=1 Tax=Actinomadura atramentaria TaxID=1990 RepID=UPI00036005D6|nr:endonuclease/exonuclease/phosphatase family protein [Actinomadura atramentaria]